MPGDCRRAGGRTRRGDRRRDRRDERIGHERATDAPSAGGGRRREERVDVDGAVQRLQSDRDFPHPLDAGGALGLEETRESASAASKK